MICSWATPEVWDRDILGEIFFLSLLWEELCILNVSDCHVFFALCSDVVGRCCT